MLSNEFVVEGKQLEIGNTREDDKKEEGDEREISDEEKTDNTVMTIVMAVTMNNS